MKEVEGKEWNEEEGGRGARWKGEWPEEGAIVPDIRSFVSGGEWASVECRGDRGRRTATGRY